MEIHLQLLHRREEEQKVFCNAHANYYLNICEANQHLSYFPDYYKLLLCKQHQEINT